MFVAISSIEGSFAFATTYASGALTTRPGLRSVRPAASRLRLLLDRVGGDDVAREPRVLRDLDGVAHDRVPPAPLRFVEREVGVADEHLGRRRVIGIGRDAE